MPSGSGERKAVTPMNKTCKDCIHYDACKDMYDGIKEDFDDKVDVECCEFFKDKDRFIELPCDKGDVLQYDGVDYQVNHWNILATSFSKDNKLHLFDIKEAKKALKGEAK